MGGDEYAERSAYRTQLTAPRVLRSVDTQLVKQHGYDDAAFDRAAEDVLDVLGDLHLTRPEVAEGLRERGHDLDGQDSCCCSATSSCGLVCSGAPPTASTPSRCRRRVPKPRASTATRHSPSSPGATSPRTVRPPNATSPYWATLTVTDVRRGIAASATARRRSSTTGARTGTRPARRTASASPAGHLLQVLDEMYRGYQD